METTKTCRYVGLRLTHLTFEVTWGIVQISCHQVTAVNSGCGLWNGRVSEVADQENLYEFWSIRGSSKIEQGAWEHGEGVNCKATS